MRRRWLTVVGLLVLPAWVWADSATVAAALPNAAAEVRYLKQLCATTQSEYAKTKTAQSAAEEGQRTRNSATLRQGFAESTVHQRLLYQALDDLKAATAVVKAKRGTLPKGAPATCPLDP